MKRAAAYARVSTQHQSKETSIEAQFEIIEEFARRQNIKIVDKFFDKDSGGKASRKNFDRMIRRALEGKYDYIIVDKFDRFFREGVEDQKLTKLLEQHGVFVIAVLEPVDPSTPAGWFARWIFSGMYEMQRRYIAEETKRKMKYAAKKGYWMGGIPPFGFKIVEVKDAEGKTRKKLVPDENEAPIVREIFKMYAEGWGLAKIAEELNKRGIKTKKGGLWAKSTLYDLLRNEKYIGIYTYSRGTKRNHHAKNPEVIYVEGAIEPIIDKSLWEAVNRRIKDRRYVSGVSKHVYLLRGLAVCAVCGAPLVGHPRSNNRPPAYVCPNWKYKKTHEYVGVSKKYLESFVDAYLEKLLFYSEIDFEKLAEELNRLEEYRVIAENSELAKARRELETVREEINNIIEFIKKGGATEHLYKELQKLEEREKQLEAKITITEKSIPSKYTAESLKQKWEELKTALHSISEEEKIRLYQTLVKKVIVYPKGYIEIELNKE